MGTGFFEAGGQPADMGKLRPAAGVIPLRNKAGEWQVYLVQRGSKGKFFPGFHAFPGGAMDSADASHAHCAARELFEETGLWVGPRQPEAEWRRRWLAGEVGWNELVDQHPQQLEGLLPAGVRTTPAYALARFRAQFFLWMCPQEQQAEVWPGELENGAWWPLDEALQAWREGEMFWAAPTQDSLHGLSRCSGFDEAVARLASIPEDTPDPIRVLPGLAYLPLETATLPPARHTLCYVLGQEALVLVDPAAPEWPRLDAVVDGREVLGVVFTHHHPDHVGGLAGCQERGWPLWAHPATGRWLGLELDRELRDGDALGVGGWQVLHTPGHASGHLALWEASTAILLAGDLVSGASTILIPPPDGHMGDYLQSLRRCSELQPRLVLPSHGGPFGPGSRLLEETLEHRLAREARLLEELGSQGGDLDELLPRVYADVQGPALEWARISLQAHLEKLLEEQRVIHHQQGYHLAPA